MLNCPSDIIVSSISDPPFELNSGSASNTRPADLTYSGPGITSNKIFNPVLAGSGTHVITFKAGIASGDASFCTAQCTFKINVGTLPVQMKTLESKVLDKALELFWETASETNFDHFEVERSLMPTKGFFKIYEVKGANIGNRYSFTDNSVQKGLPHHYRLKMVDNDGKFAYSKMVWALLEGENKLKVFPNPASGQISIESPKELSDRELFNNRGMEVLSLTDKCEKTLKVDLRKIPSGTYLLRSRDFNGKVSFSRIVIE